MNEYTVEDRRGTKKIVRADGFEKDSSSGDLTLFTRTTDSEDNVLVAIFNRGEWSNVYIDGEEPDGPPTG